MTDRIVVNSFYDHEDHGKVRVESYTPTRVTFEVREETVYVPGMSRIPKVKHERPSVFKKKVQPANVTVSAKAAVLTGSASEPE